MLRFILFQFHWIYKGTDTYVLEYTVSHQSTRTCMFLLIWSNAFRQISDTKIILSYIQELIILPEHPSSLPFFCAVRVARSLVFCVVFCRSTETLFFMSETFKQGASIVLKSTQSRLWETQTKIVWSYLASGIYLNADTFKGAG